MKTHCYQSGFRQINSNLTALIQLSDEWYQNMDNGKLTVVFLDIGKAFDSIGFIKYYYTK